MRDKYSMVTNFIMKEMRRLDVNFETEGMQFNIIYKGKPYKMQIFIKGDS